MELIRILPETYPPTVTNVFAEADSKDDVVSLPNRQKAANFRLEIFLPLTTHIVGAITNTTFKNNHYLPKLFWN